MPEPGRRIVASELQGDGAALPWVDGAGFAARAVSMAQADLIAAMSLSGFVFFDRGLIDAAVGLEFESGVPLLQTLGGTRHYARTVFLAPPWQEIFVNDVERRHSFNDAVSEFSRLETALKALGYAVCLLPKRPVQDRADFVLAQLNAR